MVYRGRSGAGPEKKGEDVFPFKCAVVAGQIEAQRTNTYGGLGVLMVLSTQCTGPEDYPVHHMFVAGIDVATTIWVGPRGRAIAPQMCFCVILTPQMC